MGTPTIVTTITRAVDIDADPGSVWQLLEDVRRLPEYSPSTLEVSDAPERLTTVGQSYTQVGKLLGKRYRSTWTVTDLEPGRRIRSEGTIGAGVRYCLTQNLTAVGKSKSRLEIVMDYTLPGGPLGRLASKAGVAARATREAEEVLDGIRSTVERDR